MKIIKTAIILVAIMVGFNVYAQPGIAVGSAIGQDGTSVIIPIVFTGDGTAVGVQMDINYDNALLIPDLSSCGTAGGSTVNSSVSCQISVVGASNVVRIVGFSIPTAVSTSGTLGDISFAIASGTAPQVLPITVTAEAYSGSTPDGSTTPGQITVTSAPAPVFTSNPADGVALTTINVVQGFGTQTSDLVITNTGNAEPLTGSCSVTTDPSSAFSLSGDTTFSVLMGGVDTNTVTVGCNNALTPATYNGTLTCTSNGGAATTYPLVCNVTPPGPAVYGDPTTPAAAPFTVDLTATSGPLLGGSAQTVTGQNLVLANTAGAGNNDLEIVSCTESAVPEVTVTNPIAANTMIAPGASAPAVTFACDVSAAAAAIATFSKTYTCDYSTDGTTATIEGTAVYTYECSTRAAASAGSPVNGTVTAMNITAPPGGSQTGTFAFSETNNEGADVTNLVCSIDAGTSADFTITTAPAATVSSGTSTALVVTLTDGGAAPLTGSITCTYDDSVMAGNSVTINLAGSIRAIIVPIMSMTGYAALIFGLLLVGFFGFRRRA